MRFFPFILLAPVVCAFTTPLVSRGVSKKDAITLNAQSNNGDSSTRRTFLASAAAAIAAALLPAQEAQAEFTNPFSSNKPAPTSKARPRVGGIASKIRNVGTVMVRKLPHFLLYH